LTQIYVRIKIEKTNKRSENKYSLQGEIDMNTSIHQKAKGISFIILFLIMTVVLFLTLTNTVAADQNKYKEITVKTGDSLWTIAEAYQKENLKLSNQAFVSWVENKNGLIRDHIVPNQKLIIPVRK
jgi:nucleoid-associated protein YgaU